MEKYKHHEDEHKLQKLIGKLVLEGRPVFVDENGLTPPELGEFDMKEVAICVSDMITDEYLQVSGEKEGAVNAISASHGYRGILVTPTKSLSRLLDKLASQEGSVIKSRFSISPKALENILQIAIGVLIVILGALAVKYLRI